MPFICCFVNDWRNPEFQTRSNAVFAIGNLRTLQSNMNAQGEGKSDAVKQKSSHVEVLFYMATLVGDLPGT